MVVVRKLVKEENYYRALEKIKSGEYKFYCEENRCLIINYLTDAELGRTILKGQKKKIQPGRLLRSLGLLKKMDAEWFRKPFDKVSEQDMNNFILSLERGLIKTSTGRSYTRETQSTIKKFIRKYYKYLLGNNVNYPDLVQFIDTSTKIPEIKPITKEENDKLIAYSSKIEHKFAFAVLFDSGARIQEFYNITRGDFSKKNGIYKLRIRISKSRARSVNLPLYSEIIEEFLEGFEGDPDEFLFNLAVGSLRKMMARLSRKVLKKRVYPHLLRHSSATYYAKHVSRYQLCYRYGWSASSNMPDRYIDMNGLIDDEVLVKVVESSISQTTKENNELRNKLKIMESGMNQSLKRLEELERSSQIREQESSIMSALHKEKIGNSKEDLLVFLKNNPQVVGQLQQIVNLLSN